jgi:magnesium transporter
MSEAMLFDRDQVERLDIEDRPRRLGRGKLLWVDVERASEENADRVAEAFGLDRKTRDSLAKSRNVAKFHDYGRYIHVTTYAPDEDDEGELIAIECVVGDRWVVTAHDESIPVLKDFAARVSGSGDTGSLDGAGFLAALLEWVLGAYSAAFERIEQRLEEFDIQAMRGTANGDAEKEIERLIKMRREVGTLRRALSAHRSALIALTHPELEALGDSNSGESFESLLTRFEATLQEARDAREAIVGSFDVLIARGGQRTNEIMKVLTLTSVIFLPGALLAGAMGMNFKVGLFETTMLFWVALAAIVAIAPVTIGVAKIKQWI